MSFYNPATAFSPTQYAVNPYATNPYPQSANPFAANPFMQQAQPQYQQAMPTQQDYSQGQQFGQTQQSALKGRPVASVDEAKNAQIDFDQSVHVFTDYANGRIYTKQLGRDGIVAFNTYALQAPSAPLQPVQQAPMSTCHGEQSTAQAKPVVPPALDIDAYLSPLQNRVSELEETIKKYKELGTNEFQSNANSKPSSGKSKPNANAPTGGNE